ncbi:signal peptidase I [Demequina sp. SO4-18]|uniref:signal peptidase I n=1 Tax=Demequina sp. SO4-18 TaxID=3401026 RepID=UPI003B5CE929
MTRLARVTGESMSPTYRTSDLLFTRPARHPGAPAGRGDVVVLRHNGRRMVKRVIGVPGDLIELEAGQLVVNGDALRGALRVRGAFTQTWSVPVAHYFVAGDNPAASEDSRVWDQPFVAFGGIAAVVVRRLPGRRRRAVTPRRPTVAGAPAA